MGKRSPLIDNATPTKEYDLDDPFVRKELGILNGDPKHPCKISDRYVVYSNGKRAIIELRALKGCPSRFCQIEVHALALTALVPRHYVKSIETEKRFKTLRAIEEHPTSVN